ncbi:hypothetical protein NFC81_11665 [Salinispirillum sp. LH 10-3-1]|uniref:Outer membrane lipoprotein-sorting protein n=1 Tax=Salinispirillum sp. LH 10-3-1 TaxID=2952525 RepID=A0AB38YDF8_9GAMM
MRWPTCVSIAFCLLLGAASNATAWQIDEVRLLVAEQYEAVDDNMLRYRYQTLATIVRPGKETVEQVTDFDPNREPGTKEQLILVDGGEPDADSLREFRRRPQPDEREEQRIRLTIQYDTLELIEEQEHQLVFRFQPGLQVNGREDSDGDKFTGRLVFNRRNSHIERVEMNATEEFSKLLFRIRQFDVLEKFYWLDGRLLRQTYYHDMDLRNALINASNEITMTFEYPDLQLAKH